MQNRFPRPRRCERPRWIGHGLPQYAHLYPFLTVLCVVSLAACGRQETTGPTGTSSLPAVNALDTVESPSPSETSYSRAGTRSSRGDFFPLQVGNRWEYLSHISLRIVNDEGTPISNDLEVHRIREMVGEEEAFGRTYMVEEVEIHEGDDVTFQRILYRQDLAGLYEADLPINVDPPGTGTVTSLEGLIAASSGATPQAVAGPGRAVEPGQRIELKTMAASKEFSLASRQALTRLEERLQALQQVVAGRPGGVEEDEILRLRYPLRPGASWTVRDDDVDFSSTVLGHETFDLPIGPTPGWRIRIESSVLGPDDHVEMWFGRIGYIGLKIELTSVVVDESGNVFGTMHLNEVEMLQEADLVGNGRNRASF